MLDGTLAALQIASAGTFMPGEARYRMGALAAAAGQMDRAVQAFGELHGVADPSLRCRALFMEGTLSQGVRRFGLRQCRYIGLAKARLPHVATAAAINVYRLSDWLGHPACGDADVAICAAGGLIRIRRQYPLLSEPQHPR